MLSVTAPLNHTEILTMLSLIFIVGIGSQWLSWIIKLPSILLLLLGGVLVGPVFGLIQPDNLLGGLFQPVVAISVALILFEDGLSLKFSEFLKSHKILLKLLTLGGVVTWGLTTVLAYYVLHFKLSLSLLIGAILIVTGPTVIVPLLHYIRPKGQVNAVLKWEGILNDPIGAIIAVLIYEVMLAGEFSDIGSLVFLGVLKTFLISLLIALLGAGGLYWVMKQRLIPDFLQIPVVLTVVVGLFTASNLFQEESGLLTVTIMGVLLANQRSVDMKPILEFKENLRVLLISGLFEPTEKVA